MSSPSQALNAFLTDTVNLPKTSLDQLETHVTSLWTTLTTGDRIPNPPTDMEPQGSWAYSTIIKQLPGREFDADVVLEFEDAGIDATEYILRVRRALMSHGVYSEMATAKTRCVRVQYAGEHHVDLVPLVHRNGARYIVNRRTNLFERAEPIGYAEWFTNADRQARGHLHKTVRLVKYLRDYKGTHATRSVILTTLLGQRVEETDSFGNTLEAFVALLARLATYLNACWSKPSLPDPSCPGATFDHRWTEEEFQLLKRVVSNLAHRVDLAHKSVTPSEATLRWREIFGDAFPAVTKLTADSTRVTRAAGEQFANEEFSAIKNHFSAHLSAVVLRKGSQRERHLGAFVERRRSLLFTLCTDAPEPYEVHWKVLNRGRESLGNQRGNIVLGARDREEQTLFRGHHYVEAYVVQDRVVVATARRNVVIR